MTYLYKPKFVQTMANTATILFALFIGVQSLVAIGVIPVTILWGGGQTELTLSLRIASVAGGLILLALIYIIRYRAGLVGTAPAPRWIRVGAWVVTGYMALNTLGNFASASDVERFVFGPITLVLVVTCLIVAASRTE